MPRQVAGNHGEILIQRPLDHMPVQADVIVVTVQQKQRRLDLLRPPAMADQLVAIDLETTHAAPHIALGEVGLVEALISLRLIR